VLRTEQGLIETWQERRAKEIRARAALLHEECEILEDEAEALLRQVKHYRYPLTEFDQRVEDMEQRMTWLLLESMLLRT
jgi:hypothetical protein